MSACRKKTRSTLTRLDDKYADFSSQQPFKIDGKLMKNEARAPDATKTHFFHQFVLDKAFPALPRSVQRSLQTVPRLSGGLRRCSQTHPDPPKVLLRPPMCSTLSFASKRTRISPMHRWNIFRSSCAKFLELVGFFLPL